MSILDRFMQQPAPQQAPAPVQPPQQQAQPNLNMQSTPKLQEQSAHNNGNPILDQNNYQQPQQPQNSNPVNENSEPAGLDKFKDLYIMDSENKKNQPEAPQSPWDINRDVLDKGVQQMNFTQTMNMDNIQKAFAEQDTNLFMQELNGLAQNMYKANLFASMQAIKTGLPQEFERNSSNIPEMVKQQLMQEQVAESPVFQHEAAKPMLQMLQTQLQQKYPNATATELATMAQEYVTDFSKAVLPNESANTQTSQQQSPADDWQSFFTPR